MNPKTILKIRAENLAEIIFDSRIIKALRNHSGQWFIFILLLFVLFSCRNKTTPGNNHSSRIRVAVLNGPAAVSIVKMMDDGALKFHDIPVDFIIRSEPSQIKSLMFRHEADFAFLPSTMAAVMYNNGLGYQAACVPLWGTMYLVGVNDTVRSVQSLKGKSVYQMGRGVVPDIVLRYILRQNGLVPDTDVKILYSFPSHVELSNAVRAGVVELGVLTEPQVSMILRDNPAARPVLDLTKEWNRVTGDTIPFAQTMLVVNKEYSANHSDTVKHFLEEYRENINWINAHPARAAGLILKHKIIPDSAVAVSSIPRCNLHYEFAEDVRDQVNDFYRVLFRLNKDVLGGKLPDENFYLKK